MTDVGLVGIGGGEGRLGFVAAQHFAAHQDATLALPPFLPVPLPAPSQEGQSEEGAARRGSGPG